MYVLPAHRGRGLGKAIVAMMVKEGPGAGYRWMLHTSDTDGLYLQFGFAPPPDNYMERPAGRRGGRRRPVAVAETGPLDRGARAAGAARVHHVPGLLPAAAQDPSLYQWVLVPQDEPAMRRHVEDALAARAKGIAVPFAVVRLADETVIGSTRFHQLDYGARREPRDVPDTCEIGYTWLAREALRTGANTEMERRPTPTHAFEVWRVRSVCLHTPPMVPEPAVTERDPADRGDVRGRPARPPSRRGIHTLAVTRRGSASPRPSGPPSGSTWEGSGGALRRRGRPGRLEGLSQHVADHSRGGEPGQVAHDLRCHGVQYLRRYQHGHGGPLAPVALEIREEGRTTL